jgi:hypothetical protein
VWDSKIWHIVGLSAKKQPSKAHRGFKGREQKDSRQQKAYIQKHTAEGSQENRHLFVPQKEPAYDDEPFQSVFDLHHQTLVLVLGPIKKVFEHFVNQKAQQS